ncbi:uncharacterized protein LOC129600047 [Paramacrobiotus metropolitanus]|uniref:uncharacterized protein LOC129600047 n=1 Tax=Paramacrobiotus metropolitanus TaxID=2943436 RepID=UPI00244564C0|nr:uncharacterized protein LOC129600047 [Paramacrobiotus metropolitanus]
MLVIGLLSVLTVVTGSGMNLEKDCHHPTFDYEKTGLPNTTFPFPFRTDLLTMDECNALAAIDERHGCGLLPTMQPNCNITEHDYNYKNHPLSRTILRILQCQQKKRSDMQDFTGNISRISPNRAVTIVLAEKSRSVDSDVIGPIRLQIVDLTVISNNHFTTGKVYEAGILPRLLRFEVCKGRRLVVYKQDFARMPEVRMICFGASVIDHLQRYTFMDLPHLRSLMLEKDITFELNAKEMLAERSSTGTYKPKFMSNREVMELRHLHCDCSMTWFRNFLKLRQLLAEREVGEVFIVGNYLSPYIHPMGSLHSQMMSVDCARELTYNNTRVGMDFSYNTYCDNIGCHF